MRKQTDKLVNVGGISEDFVTFDSGSTYEIGPNCRKQWIPPRVKQDNNPGGAINSDYFTRLEGLALQSWSPCFPRHLIIKQVRLIME